MATKGKRLVEGAQLTTSAATYYTAPANTRVRIDAVTLTNTSGAAATVTLHLVPAGGTAGDGNMIAKEKSLDAGESATAREALGHWLEPGGSIQALASAATSVTLVASGVEVV